MGGILGALIGAGISLAGGLLQNRSARSQASQQMAFQDRMSSTSYQRGMKDMKKAGLNPILAYKQGGATSPAGSMAPVINPAKDIGVQVASAASASAQAKTTNEMRDALVDTQISTAKEASNKAAISAPRALANSWILEGMLKAEPAIREQLGGIVGGTSAQSQAKTGGITQRYLGDPSARVPPIPPPWAKTKNYTGYQAWKAKMEREKKAYESGQKRKEVARKPYYTIQEKRDVRAHRFYKYRFYGTGRKK